jgi:threonine dehydrogenase-like Zn-dependent dehydrogenase
MHACYHTTPGSYVHSMDIRQGGKMAILAGAGPMGLAMINYVLSREDRRPSLCVVTDIDQARLNRAAEVISVKIAAERGIDLKYINTSALADAVMTMRDLTGGSGYDEVFVLAPVSPVIEQGDSLLAFDGCLNFFAGPSDPELRARMNFYNVHYAYTHVVATSGGNNNDMVETLEVLSKGLDPGGLVTHIGGLNAVAETTLNLPHISGGKKLIYTHIDMPLTAIGDFEKLGNTDPLFAQLAVLVKENMGLWSIKAENFLLEHFRELS